MYLLSAIIYFLLIILFLMNYVPSMLCIKSYFSLFYVFIILFISCFIKSIFDIWIASIMSKVIMVVQKGAFLNATYCCQFKVKWLISNFFPGKFFQRIFFFFNRKLRFLFLFFVLKYLLATSVPPKLF